AIPTHRRSTPRRWRRWGRGRRRRWRRGRRVNANARMEPEPNLVVDEVAGATGIEADAVRARSRGVKADTAANKKPVPQLVRGGRRRGGEAPDILAERSARAFVAVQRDRSN